MGNRSLEEILALQSCAREPLPCSVIKKPASAAIYIAMPLSKINYAILCYTQVL